MSNNKTRLEEKLQDLRIEYAQSLSSRLIDIRRTYDKLQQTWNPSTAKELLRYCHNLAGSGATFGFHTLSNLARELEILVDTHIKDKTLLTGDLVNEIAHHLENIEREMKEVQQSVSPAQDSNE